jgi:hypothetical protein
VKRPPTKAERQHLDRVAALCCIACKQHGFEDTPAEIHHIDRDRNHFRVLPLCPIHHRNGGRGEAIHAGRETWVEIYGTEEELLADVNTQIGVI